MRSQRRPLLEWKEPVSELRVIVTTLAIVADPSLHSVQMVQAVSNRIAQVQPMQVAMLRSRYVSFANLARSFACASVMAMGFSSASR